MALANRAALLPTRAQLTPLPSPPPPRSVADRLGRRAEAYEKQREALSNEMLQAIASKETDRLPGLSRAIRSTGAFQRQLLQEALIDFLSAEHWLPSYAFPQDVVRLLVRQEKYTDRMRLERDGEIGLSEYAPGAEIIADGKLFKSGGIDLRRKRARTPKIPCVQCVQENRVFQRFATSAEGLQQLRKSACGSARSAENICEAAGVYNPVRR